MSSYAFLLFLASSHKKEKGLEKIISDVSDKIWVKPFDRNIDYTWHSLNLVLIFFSNFCKNQEVSYTNKESQIHFHKSPRGENNRLFVNTYPTVTIKKFSRPVFQKQRNANRGLSFTRRMTNFTGGCSDIYGIIPGINLNLPAVYTNFPQE